VRDNGAMGYFDLMTYLGEHFAGLELGPGLFYRWPFGIRFEIGLTSVPTRPAALFESAFSPSDTCVLIAKDWPVIGLSTPDRLRYLSLFRLLNDSDPAFAPMPEQLQNIFDSAFWRFPQQAELQVAGEVEEGLDRFVLSWLELPSRSFRYDLIFRAIGNTEHGESPSMSSDVFFLNRRTQTIFYMYDDRGGDMISTGRNALLPIYKTFEDWVLEYDRPRIAAALNV
jgi:hypothetical protein